MRRPGALPTNTLNDPAGEEELRERRRDMAKNIYREPDAFGLELVGSINWSRPDDEHDYTPAWCDEYDYTAVWRDEDGNLYVGHEDGCLCCHEPFGGRDIESLSMMTTCGEVAQELLSHSAAYGVDRLVELKNEIEKLLARAELARNPGLWILYVKAMGEE